MELVNKTSLLGMGTKVVVHPIVLLSVVDHYNRCAQGTSRRVVGTILGETISGELHLTNSYAIPFEEDTKNPLVWYFDHNYHENMFKMFKKINAKERVLGWYSTGPKCKLADLEIHEIYRKYCPHPIYIIVDITQKDELPIEAYISVEEPTSDSRFRRTFVHVPFSVGSFDAEEVGLEHLLRDLTNSTTSTLSKKVESKISALRSLVSKLTEMVDYLGGVISGTYTLNPSIVYMLQDIFNMFPAMDDEELIEAFAINMNDTTMTSYLGTIIRTMIALHNLINNMAENKRRSQLKLSSTT
ncbi:26S proteasome non-ATPase regulatory subunit 7-like protein [Theileria parva strain Muguga]|uniref:26S proteasome regulatory subunit, putative n=1 Tax=Theileria parva TaxID=5875 RepID=Q4N2V6_THEPA|nr:26S proteasome non-ATPase regulatory subunit 7-like protein [Theileria parva strain Muguga]EAN31588.1 26S proteasome non-ATPase regulatory subunit 7-like protein [Theileria parva strain Muguga]|eukprot:XP_763871.1 26S proteasome regulatory subunit [Theileria parva strain Muguga]